MNVGRIYDLVHMKDLGLQPRRSVGVQMHMERGDRAPRLQHHVNAMCTKLQMRP